MKSNQEMTVSKLRWIFKYKDVLDLEKDGIKIFRDGYEVWNPKTGNEKQFDNIEDLLNGTFEGINIKSALEKADFLLRYSGGRGSSSGPMGGGFTSAGDRGGSKAHKVLPTAPFNIQGRYATQDAAIKMFTEKYKNAKIEYGVSIDDMGFVHRHVEGGSHSVAISAMGRNHMVVHNHPSGGNFSLADLQVTAADRKASGVIATGSKATYTIRKTQKFAAKDFTKAVNNAKWPAKMTYDEGADWWLKKNQKKYGYSYTVS